MPSYKYVLGQRVYDLRKEHGETQDELAKALGMKSHQSVANIEKGLRKTPLETVCAIADHYSVSLDYLLGRHDIPSANLETQEICQKTGLTQEALKAIHELKKNYDHTIETGCGDVVSTVIASEYFTYLIGCLVDLQDLADKIEHEIMVRNGDIQVDPCDPDIDLESMTRALEFGKYAFVEPCSRILDNICYRPVDKLVAVAKDHIEKDYTYREEQETDKMEYPKITGP